MLPDITVIIPVYRTEAYVERCVRSVMDQTFTSIEILCIDDQSPDNSLEILRRLATEDRRIRVISHSENLGSGGARNTGIAEARSDWIASVDSDDYILPRMLESLWEGTEGGYYDVVVCGYDRVDENGETISTHPHEARTHDPLPLDISPFEVSAPAFWNKLWRKSLFTETNIWFPTRIYYQDAATTPRVYLERPRMRFISGTPYKYFRRDDAITHSISDKHILDHLRYLDVLKNYLLSSGKYLEQIHNFRYRVMRAFAFHARNVTLDKNIPADQKLSYLRYLLLLREGYLAMDDLVRQMSTGQKGSAVQSHAALLTYGRSALPKKASLAGGGAGTSGSESPEPRLIILRVVRGASESARNLGSLESQTYTNWVMHEVEPNADGEVGATILAEYERLRGIGDYFVQFEDDLIFADVFVLADLVTELISDKSVDLYSAYASDEISGEATPRLHFVSNRAVRLGDGGGPEALGGLLLPGKRRVGKKAAAPRILWRPDPSDEQAFEAGLVSGMTLGREIASERGDGHLTAYQEGRRIEATWWAYKRGKQRSEALFLYGVLLSQPQVSERLGVELRVEFREAAAELPDATLCEELERVWERDSAGEEIVEAFSKDDYHTGSTDGSIERDYALGARSVPRGDFAELAISGSFGSVYRKARAAMCDSLYKDALLLMMAAQVKKPESRFARVGEAECLIALGRREDAVRAYTNALEMRPGDREFTKRLAQLTSGEGNLTPVVPRELRAPGKMTSTS